MTLDDLIDALDGFQPDAPLTFATQAGEIGRGYHVTELKLAKIDSIDCGGRVTGFEEAQLQLLDGRAGPAMTVGKFLGIATQSREALAGLGGATLKVEFAHGNDGKSIFQPLAPVARGARVEVALFGDAAVCKPVADRTLSCCAAGVTACC